MRKTLVVTLVGAVSLVTAAVALAAVYTAVGVSPTTATLTATGSATKTRTCTGGDGVAFAVTEGRYTGNANFAVPETDLDGPLTISARSTVDTTHNVGYVEGWFRVKDDDSRLTGRFSGTLDKDKKFTGFLSGTSRGDHAKVLGTLNGTFDPAKGFVGDATVGSASSSAALAVVAGPICKNAPKPHPVRLQSVEGQIAEVGDGKPGSKITLKMKGPSYATCTLDAESPSTAGFTVGTKVEMKCAYLGTAPNQLWTLRMLKRDR